MESRDFSLFGERMRNEKHLGNWIILHGKEMKALRNVQQGHWPLKTSLGRRSSRPISSTLTVKAGMGGWDLIFFTHLDRRAEEEEQQVLQ